MAIGIRVMFNIRLPENLNSPYKAVSIIDFWKRWHITLSNFIMTYLYTPILRSFGRITFVNSLAAIFLAMFISGVWHCAGWNFIIWGALHALTLVLNHLFASMLAVTSLLSLQRITEFIYFNFYPAVCRTGPGMT